jgi:hypothetical protein
MVPTIPTVTATKKTRSKTTSCPGRGNLQLVEPSGPRSLLAPQKACRAMKCNGQQREEVFLENLKTRRIRWEVVETKDVTYCTVVTQLHP